MNLAQFKDKKILVFGDIFLDVYHSGIVHRLTPDAPVPVIKIKKTDHFLGGAGNVVQNIHGLGGDVYFVGVCGNDPNGDLIRKKFDENNIGSRLFIIENPTITKINIIGEREEGEKQKIARLDIEEKIELSVRDEVRIIDHISAIIDQFAVCVISDYAKGSCSENICSKIITLANQNSIPILIDPKGSDWRKYQNSTLIKPNINELSEISGNKIKNEDQEIESAGESILNKFKISFLLVTRSFKGGSLISLNEKFHFFPNTDKVVNVIGAGDTFIACLSLCFAGGFNIRKSVNIANHAAGLAVSKISTSIISLPELEYKLNIQNRVEKLMEVTALKENIQMIKDSEKKIVFTNGYFDILHNGHIEHLKQAKKLGDVLIVGINSDKSAEMNKKKLIHNEINRAQVLSSIQYVDHILIFDNNDPSIVLKIVKPDMIVKGGNYRESEIVGSEFAGKSVILPFITDFSSKKIRNKLLESD
ncbi:MAG: bifunctional heptose 7-phosphate kinase/heptose 1-phosphate adenyltransferase [Candidatus Cloacimonetes bacterium]|nr:bifunctional heptose 7-phosphate kinase/heptose 1-phosphate adenyltransferase [Candidatus Cloacimonadota bacterium]